MAESHLADINHGAITGSLIKMNKKMNKKIAELIQKAMVPSATEGLAGPYMELDPERLVRLTIQECMNVCYAQRDPMNLNYKPSIQFAGEIERNFRD